MNVGNTAAVFAPNLLRPRVESIEQLADTVHIVNLVALMISEPYRIFQSFVGGDDSAIDSAREASGRDSTCAPTALDTSGAHREASRYCLSSASSIASEPFGLEGVASAAAASAATIAAATVAAPVQPLTPVRLWYYLNDAHEQQGPVRTCCIVNGSSQHPTRSS